MTQQEFDFSVMVDSPTEQELYDKIDVDIVMAPTEEHRVYDFITSTPTFVQYKRELEHKTGYNFTDYEAMLYFVFQLRKEMIHVNES